MHDVQFVVVIEHVRHCESHCVTLPDILTYPLGTYPKHCPVK